MKVSPFRSPMCSLFQLFSLTKDGRLRRELTCAEIDITSIKNDQATVILGHCSFGVRDTWIWEVLFYFIFFSFFSRILHRARFSFIFVCLLFTTAETRTVLNVRVILIPSQNTLTRLAMLRIGLFGSKCDSQIKEKKRFCDLFVVDVVGLTNLSV